MRMTSMVTMIQATHYSSTASYSIPTMSRFESAPTQAAGPAAPRFTQNLPGATVRANSGTAPPKLHGNSFAAESSRVSSAINSRARDTSSAPSSRFNRHAYGHPSTAPISQRGGTSVSGSSTSTKDKSSRKWPKGDNRKKFDVLPPFE
ncbi:uncharacterized protein B0I36DRAFT_5649 [Microdochium trichocladiopsis]|uniref:Uncharacterized protein n=1 Tax=Microdochium trichocladiopsis TaxID=1682393 RepID=A0A9P8YGI0_9PEZI|nr:uncharacterized protein B0I36DRAFT_5649 [Microdochium trichocladiopsis]KAH7040101.1 hypothetical protein B0I36DRAFT_5649 [Microdochium trichocladiopsis]